MAEPPAARCLQTMSRHMDACGSTPDRSFEHLCESGGTGRRAGLRIQRVIPVGVQLPPLAPSRSASVKVDVQELGACKRRLQVEETPEVVADAWERAFTRVQREARLPGFRKGKVPRSMIKLPFADDVKQEVARHLIPDVYRQALEETKLRPVEEPDLQDVTLEESAPLKFSAVVEIKPAVALGKYAGLGVTHAPKPFADSEVDDALAHMQ